MNNDRQASDNSNIDSDSNQTVIIPVTFPEITDIEITKIIGKGGSGTVYKGNQPFLQRDVAIKLLNVTQGDDDFTKRFQREAQILAKLVHPNIVTCYQAGLTNETPDIPSTPYIAMEFISGPSLLDLIQTETKLDQPLALKIIINIASALKYALEQNIIHRDIKAENILLQPLNKTAQDMESDNNFHYMPKLADLGIARTTVTDESENLTRAGFVLGTPSSMAPEQFNHPEQVDYKADIYGLGCVLFHMLTGHKPFKGKNLTELIIEKNTQDLVNPKTLEPTIDSRVADLVCSMIAKEKDDRPDTYDTLIEQCQTISNKLRKPKSSKANNTHSSIAVKVLAVFVLIIVSLGSFYGWRQMSNPSIDKQQVITQPFASEITDNITETTENQNPGILPDPQADSETEKVSETNLAISEAQANTEQETMLAAFPRPESAIEQIAKQAKDEDELVPQPDNNLIEPLPPELMSNQLEMLYVDKENPILSAGESFHIMLRSQQNAFVYCFFENQYKEIIRFFPNRFRQEAFVRAQSPLVLPGEMPFEMNASKDDINERIACFTTDIDLTSQMPEQLASEDFNALSVTSLEQLESLFENIKNQSLTSHYFEIQVQQLY